MQFAILGPLQVTGAAGDDIPVAGGRLRALATRLAADAGHDVPTADLVEALWPDDPPAGVGNALQSLVSRLRRALGDAALVQQGRLGYRLPAGRGSRRRRCRPLRGAGRPGPRGVRRR